MSTSTVKPLMSNNRSKILNNMANNELDVFSQLKRFYPFLNEKPESEAVNDFSESVDNWYFARHYVLNILQFGRFSILPSSSKHINIVIDGVSDLMLCIARQIALVAHYPNFDETSGSNRTVITMLFDSSSEPEIIQKVSREEYLCNLPTLCKYSVKTWDGKNVSITLEKNKQSYIDIELEFIDIKEDNSDNYLSSNKIKEIECIGRNDTYLLIKEKTVREKLKNVDIKAISTINITNARRTNMVYCVGGDIDNLAPDDPNTTDRYSRALHYFCYQQKEKEIQKKWDVFFKKDDDGKPTNMINGQIAVRNILSNVYCSDCFESRILSVVTQENLKMQFQSDWFKNIKCQYSNYYKGIMSDKRYDIDSRTLEWLLNKKYRQVLRIVRENIASLAKCEHARWNVEKLINGFVPLTVKERYEDNICFGESRNSYRKNLKNKAHHIDLCSYQDLRRINPSDMKYDCFLMMAMVRILKENFKANENQV